MLEQVLMGIEESSLDEIKRVLVSDLEQGYVDLASEVTEKWSLKVKNLPKDYKNRIIEQLKTGCSPAEILNTYKLVVKSNKANKLIVDSQYDYDAYDELRKSPFHYRGLREKFEKVDTVSYRMKGE